MNTTVEVKSELRIAAAEHSAATARMAELKATVLNRSLPMELRLRAHMEIDAKIFARQSRFQEFADDTLDKIALAKKRGEARRNVRRHAQRIAAGLPTRPRKDRTVGTWSSGERRDGFKATDGRCLVCGGAIDRHRSRTCSPKCARAVP